MREICKNCYGCGVCASTCPQKTISLQIGEDGTKKAYINEKNCIHCNKCRDICPGLVRSAREEAYAPEIYCSWSSDEASIRKSSSGGVFFELAKYVVEHDGYVCGAIYVENKVKHIISRNMKEIEQMRGSKYVESDISCILTEMRQLLNGDQIVLFSGTPCQCSAMRNLFPRKVNIILVEVICNGVQYPLVLEKEIERLKSNNSSRLISYSMRYKENSYFPLYMKACYEDGSNDILPLYETPLGLVYGSRIALKDCCYQCGYKGFPRVSDITLGDYHGFELAEKCMIPEYGASTVIINSCRGAGLIQKVEIESYIQIIPCVNVDVAILNNGRLIIKGFAPSRYKRELFKKRLLISGLESNLDIVRRYYKKDKVIMRKLYEIVEKKKAWK